MATFSEDLKANDVLSALRNLCSEEIGFTLTTKETEKGPVIEPLKIIHYEDLVEWKIDASFDCSRALSTLHDIVFKLNSTTPLWKIVIFNNCHVFFITDHVICDGTAIINFQRLFVKHLNAARQFPKREAPFSQSVVFDRSQSDTSYFSSSVDSYLNLRPSLAFLATTVMKTYAPTWLQNMVKPSKFGPFNLTGTVYPIPSGIAPSVHTNIHCVSITTDQMNRLHNLAKSHGVKLTSLLMYLIAKSFETIIDTCNMTRDLHVEIPVNCRHLIDYRAVLEKEPGYTGLTGCYASSIGINMPSKPLQNEDDRLNWDYVASFQLELDRSFNARDPQSLLGLLNYIGVESYIKDISEKQSFSGSTLELSNVGYFELQQSDEKSYYKIEDIWFSQCAGMTGSLIDVNVIGFEKGLRITLGCDQMMPLANKVGDMAHRLVTDLSEI
ncbi:hypothetical protein FOA43_001799 [Brettanomyces nanus]|uniref:Uncharacterized protein n=1 Tax=Eeniella nana TaxID=13502 RepID=A0A875S3W8_EENNA|nr:uncharacterized protein FOA43_001799 [Brettanomyces nanus]QPG74469.1 hypothetical protein FOA43_001799 [Brettanomyces nanus]